MTAPSISVCVPTYNGAAFLEEALESIARQTFDDFDVLVLDDRSRDDTVAIARSFAVRDARFRVEINPSNLGLVGNWNRCIELARGRWIKLAFQDDLLGADCLEKMFSAGETVQTGLVACARHVLFETGTDPSVERYHAAHDRMLESVYVDGGQRSADDYCAAKLANLRYNIVGEPTATLVRRDQFTRWGGFDASLVQICDAEMWDRLATNAGIVYLSERLVTFRVHAGSASGKNREEKFRSGLLEEIVYLHALCYAPAFEHLRRYASRIGQGSRLRRRLTARVSMAQDQVRWAEGLGRDRESMQMEFDAVVRQLPAVENSRLANLAWRIRRRLGLPLTEFEAE